MHLPTFSQRVLVTVAALSLAVPASADPTTTRPDSAYQLNKTRLKQLRTLADELNHHRWGEPIVEDFDNGEAAKPWKTESGAKVSVRDGQLVVEAARKNQYYLAHRTLPADIKSPAGLRVDVWLDVTSVEKIPRLGVVLTNSAPQVLQGDYVYYFAYTQQGRYQRLTVENRHSAAMVSDEATPKKLMHIQMQLAGQMFSARRDKLKELKEEGPKSIVIGPKTRIGFCGREGSIRVRRIVYRPLAPALTDQQKARLWQDAPFGSQQALDGYLTEHVIALLGSPSFRERHDATETLSQLMPLSLPAVKAAKARKPSPEIRVRLEAVEQTPRQINVDSIPADKLGAPNKEKPADGEPAGDAAKESPAKRAQPPADPAPPDEITQ